MMASTARIGASLTGGLGEIEVRATTHADLIRDRHDVAALRALPQGIVLLVAVEERREDADARRGQPDQEPDPERASLHPADHPGRDAEHDRDYDEDQSTRMAQMTATTASTASTIQTTAAIAPMTILKRRNAAN